jgi:hypothetical protein
MAPLDQEVTIMFGAKTRNARGKLIILQEGTMRIHRLEVPAFVITDVEILVETPEAYGIQYSAKFKKRYPDLCTDHLIRKDDTERFITYSYFTATEPLPAPDSTMRARCTASNKVFLEALSFSVLEETSVIIAEETPTHYRLRFTPDFARRHPSLCRQWVARDSDDPRVETVV